MFALSKKLRFAAVGTLVVLGGYGLPARANDLTEVLGPVGPMIPSSRRLAAKVSSPFTRQMAAIAACTL